MTYEHQTTNTDLDLNMPIYLLKNNRLYEKLLLVIEESHSNPRANQTSNAAEAYINIYDPTIDYLFNVLHSHSLRTGTVYSDLIYDKKVVSDGISSVKIFYDQMRVETSYEDIADPASSLISDLGGQLGLWLGVSMVSIMELTLLLHKLISGQFRRNDPQKAPKKKPIAAFT